MIDRWMNNGAGMGAAVVCVATLAGAAAPALAEQSVARQWNEALLDAIRRDLARPTIHARNLYHTSLAMWDAWAVYDPIADGVLTSEKLTAADVEAARNEAISYAAYRILMVRFATSPGADESLAQFTQLMLDLGYDPSNTTMLGTSPAAVGNRCAMATLSFGLLDHSNEQNGYENVSYEPINPPLVPDFPGNPDIIDLNRWQPLALQYFVDQSGNPIPTGYPDHLSPEWGRVTAFALSSEDLTVYERDGFEYWVYHDPGHPPYIGGDGDADYKWGFSLVAAWSKHLDPADGVVWDISPGGIGGVTLPPPGSDHRDFYDLLEGGDPGLGHAVNPATGLPYEPQYVPRGDYARVLAEFWADGPHSETPPGHWFTILNYVTDHPLHENRWGGQGDVLDQLEWDVRAYLTLGGAMHDAAVAAWGVKGWYDYVRPVSAIRAMADRGQSSDPNGPSYHVDGIMLIPDVIEVITPESSAPGERHAHLAGNNNVHVGKIAINGWRGPTFINDPGTDVAGVGWIRAEDWWPYQRPSFVSPPFAGFVSGHSTYSRAAAEVMTLMTGDAYFPGGMGEFHAAQNQYLVFEDGPSVDMTLQWATYRDASDQCSLSRIWGGIHPPADDLPGRYMGEVIGPEAWEHANRYISGTFSVCAADTNLDGQVNLLDLNLVLTNFQRTVEPGTSGDATGDGLVGIDDLQEVIIRFGGACN